MKDRLLDEKALYVDLKVNWLTRLKMLMLGLMIMLFLLSLDTFSLHSGYELVENDLQ